MLHVIEERTLGVLIKQIKHSVRGRSRDLGRGAIGHLVYGIHGSKGMVGLSQLANKGIRHAQTLRNVLRRESRVKVVQDHLPQVITDTRSFAASRHDYNTKFTKIIGIFTNKKSFNWTGRWTANGIIASTGKIWP